MLDAHAMERSDNRPLEQAPDTLDTVGVGLSDNPLLRGMAHGPVYGVMISNPHVGLQFIGVNGLSLILDGSMNEIVQGSPPDIRDALDSDLSAVPLDGSGHPGLAFLASRSYIAPLSTDQGFVHFHDTEKRRPLEGVVSHGLSDAVAQIPGGLVRDSQSAVKLVRAHTLLGFAHEIDSGKPLSQGQVGVVHDGSRGHAEMIAASLAVPLSAPLDSSDRCIPTPDTGNPIRPAQVFQVLAAFVIIVETIKHREDIHESNP